MFLTRGVSGGGGGKRFPFYFMGLKRPNVGPFLVLKLLQGGIEEMTHLTRRGI